MPSIELLVTWDGEVCTYEGPESAPVGSRAMITYRNDGDLPSDLEVDYLSTGTTLEEHIAAMPAEYRPTDPAPPIGFRVIAIPPIPASVEPGGETTGEVALAVARLHVFHCWGGGTLAAVQTIDTAPTGLQVTDG